MPLVRKYEDEAIASGEVDYWPTFDNYPVRGEAVGRTIDADDNRQVKRIKKVP